jgi:superfamily I DNA and RNA helicase
MKEKYVILDEIAYDDGAYETIINTAIGTFTGYTEPDELDSQYLSIYHASEISLAKALRKFAEAAVSSLKREIKLLEGLVKQSVDIAFDDYDIDNTSFRLINGTLKQKKKELKVWENRVTGISSNIINRIAARDKIVANYIKKDKTE